ncbi:UNVERIFIED_ORG: hypothetical protein J2Y81_006842 [Paraburkholderia sediminicola]|nr:hypothetical protein [Paraburkholderia sediminicola]
MLLWGLLPSFCWFVACAALAVSVLRVLAFPCSGFGAFPCIVSGLLALPLCGAALTFFAAAKKVSKESGGGFNRSAQHLCSNTEMESGARWDDKEDRG